MFTGVMDDFIWLAGFLDGDGALCINRQKDSRNGNGHLIYYNILISITNTNLGLLEELQNWLGGSLTSNHKIKPEWKQLYQLKLVNSQACYILENTLPYFRIKKRQAEVLLSCQWLKDEKIRDKVDTRRRANWVWEELENMKEEITILNRRGAIPSGLDT